MLLQVDVYAKPGELMQGELPGHQSFLLSNKSSCIFKSTTVILPAFSAIPLPLGKKSEAAVSLFWEGLSTEQKKTDLKQLHISQSSNIPTGKGLSSSSADVLGILSALNQFYKTDYSAEKLYSLAASIEPTDPCLHTEHLLLNQRKGEILKTFDPRPFQLIYFDSDPEAIVDTIDFSKTVCYKPAQHQHFQALYEHMVSAWKQNDYTVFYHCIRSSAEINNCYLPKKNFHVLYDFAMSKNIGLFVAHSGTYIGLVIAPDIYEGLKQEAVSFIKKYWRSPIYSE